jgi:hypothetical protein
MVAPRQTPVNEVNDVSDDPEGLNGRTRVSQPDEVGGWLLLLCLLLLVAQPVSLAFSAARSLGALPTRGIPLALVVLCQLMIAGIGVAAGLALLGRRRGAVTLAKWSLVLSAAMDQFAYATPFLPNNRLPGTTPLYAAASLLYYVVWLEYLLRSKRVRRTIPPA